MTQTKLYLIRHGETAWNVEQRCQGHTDIPLNAEGQAQAQKLGNAMRDVPLDAIYASDLRRALQTAEKIAKPRELKVEKRLDLRERAYGEWEGLTREQIADRYPEQLNIRREGGIYGIESFNDLQERVVRALTELAQNHRGDTFAAVSHGGTINAFLHWVTDGELGTGVTTIENTSVTQLTFPETGEWTVVDVNRTVHLEDTAE